MFKQLKKELADIKPAVSDLRKFGIILSFLVVTWAILFSSWVVIFIIVGFLFFLIAFFVPLILKFIYLPLIVFGTIVGFFLFRIFLTIIFFVVLTPIRVLAYGFRKNKFFDPRTKSYWHPHSK